MTTLLETFKEIKDETLTKGQVEDYFASLSSLRADIRIELAGIKKERSMFILRYPEKTMAQREAEWRGTDKGQREIDLKAYVQAIGDNLNSLKTRIYALL